MQLFETELMSFRGRVTRIPFACAAAVYFALGVLLPLQFEVSFAAWLVAITGLNALLCSFPVRRLHDLGDSGLGAIWTFIPFIGQAYWLKLTLRRGTVGYNRYGVDPLKYKFTG